MRANPRVASLLAVQKQRVDRALAAVHERNAMLRQRESERQAALERWEGAVDGFDSESRDGYPGGKADRRVAAVRPSSGLGYRGCKSAWRFR
jgi:hypothetical protein